MKISVEYYAHLRDAAGANREDFDLSDGATIEHLAEALAKKHGTRMRQLLFDSHGALAANLVFAVGDRQVVPGERTPLHDRDLVAILPPISGGAIPLP